MIQVARLYALSLRMFRSEARFEDLWKRSPLGKVILIPRIFVRAILTCFFPVLEQLFCGSLIRKPLHDKSEAVYI